MEKNLMDSITILTYTIIFLVIYDITPVMQVIPCYGIYSTKNLILFFDFFVISSKIYIIILCTFCTALFFPIHHLWFKNINFRRIKEISYRYVQCGHLYLRVFLKFIYKYILVCPNKLYRP